ncbi:hypothetical protein [Aeromicrobium massiliense]|uniref:hypothetical protein n=1 Tax=Aeromicrobium massiliense TaxID=1464554 RepID=UPI000AF1CAFA|nr:hypothetical protein [Aeromicrobium massiliense]
MPDTPPGSAVPPRAQRSPRASDVLWGAGALSLTALGLAARVGRRAARPAVRVVLDPPLVPFRLGPVLLAAVERHGRAERAEARRAADRLLVAVVPAVVDHLGRLLPVTDLVRRNLDLQALVADVDVDAVLRDLDLTALVSEHVDLDAVAATLDVEALLGRLDLTALVAKHVDLDALAATLDVDALLRRLDLTALVTEHVDLDAVAATLDLDALVARVQLDVLARDVIAAVDLPEIIRESSGSLAAETVRSVRMQGISADSAVDRFVERLRRRSATGRQPRDAPA